MVGAKAMWVIRKCVLLFVIPKKSFILLVTERDFFLYCFEKLQVNFIS